MYNFLGVDPTTGIALFILGVAIALGITSVSSSRNTRKWWEEWRAIPLEKRPAHERVRNSPSRGAVILGIIVIVAVAYIMVKG